MTSKSVPAIILALWIMMVVLGLTGRSFLPIDETRYVTVAWNMWQSGDYWVPYLNGVAYSHKPPLLFWLMNIGWSLFGVSDWWPRLIPSLFALASVYITRKISLLLWPNNNSIKDSASFILISAGLWVVYSTALMFDMLIAFFTVLGLWGLLLAMQSLSSQQQATKGWLPLKSWGILSLAIAGGLLAKGPTILLQILPVAILAPYWFANQTQAPTLKNWYLPILYTVLGGAVIALIWAIPAGIHGGAQYQHDIFWGQTADRMVNSFAHKRPIWWYLSISPLLLFPWLLLGSFWRNIFKSKALFNDTGIRFCLAWLLPVFIAFSFISGKQVHYVLPIFPACALLFARFIHHENNISKLDILPITTAFIAIGVALFVLPHFAKTHHLSVANWAQFPLWPGILAVALGVFLFFYPKKSIALISICSITLVSTSVFMLIHTAGDAYDIRSISYQVKSLEDRHIPVAYIGKYAGTYNFVGRLKNSPDVVADASAVSSWFNAHPNGRVIAFFSRHEFDIQKSAQQAEFTQVYKGKTIAVLNQSQWLAHQSTTQTDLDADTQ